MFLLARDVTHRNEKEASRGVQTVLHGSILPTVVSLLHASQISELVSRVKKIHKIHAQRQEQKESKIM